MFIEFVYNDVLLDIKIFSIYFVFNSQYIFQTSLPSFTHSCCNVISVVVFMGKSLG